MAKQIKNVPLENDSLQVVESKKTPKQVFTLENLNPALLPELASFKEKQLQVVKDSPFVKITDTASRELAKKHRTARVSARTALQSQDKLISSKFNEAKTKAKTYIAELIELTQPGELEQQKEIDRDEAVLEEKRNEKARLEKERIENIKTELNKYSDEWKDAFNLMTFQTIENIGANFYESYTTFDTTILQEFESLFPSKVEELTKILADKTTILADAENARVEKEKKDLELKRTRELISTGFSFDGNNYFVSDFKRLDMGTILSLSDDDFDSILKAGKVELDRLAEIENQKAIEAKKAEDKLKSDKEKFEKEKAEFEKKQAIAVKKETFENRKQILLDLGFSYELNREYNFQLEGVWSCFHEQIDDCTDEWFEEYLLDIKEAITKKQTPSPELLHGIESEDKAIELIQNVDSSVPENTTAIVCSPIIAFEGPTKDNPSNLKMTPLTPGESFVAPTWDSIAEEFKSSGEKSYSAWLKNNYNVPTKIH